MKIYNKMNKLQKRQFMEEYEKELDNVIERVSRECEENGILVFAKDIEQFIDKEEIIKTATARVSKFSYDIDLVEKIKNENKKDGNDNE